MNNSSFEHVYSRVIGPDLARKHRITNVYKLPRIKGVVLHIHSKQLISNLKEIRPVYNALSFIAGTEPMLVFAKKSISQYNVRRGTIVGCKVSLHGRRLFSFLDYLQAVFFDSFKLDNLSLKLSHESDSTTATLSFGVKNLIKFSHIESHAFSLKSIKGLNIAFSFTNSSSIASFVSCSSLFPVSFISK